MFHLGKNQGLSLPQYCQSICAQSSKVNAQIQFGRTLTAWTEIGVPRVSQQEDLLCEFTSPSEAFIVYTENLVN